MKIPLAMKGWLMAVVDLSKSKGPPSRAFEIHMLFIEKTSFNQFLFRTGGLGKSCVAQRSFLTARS
jgi:hypothetical protein